MSDVEPSDPHHLFVYGTLQPGESRWHHLAPFVAPSVAHSVDTDGIDDAVSGALFDTGVGYPAARFDREGRIVGRVYELIDVVGAMVHLDEVEGAVRGLYRRVVVHTDGGVRAWAYECGDDELLVRHLPGGDWRQRDEPSSTGSWG